MVINKQIQKLLHAEFLKAQFYSLQFSIHEKSCGTEQPFIKIIFLYQLIRRDTRLFANEAFMSNPIVPSKQQLSTLKTTNCLGPLLFLIFVNDLHKVTKYLDPIMFVENTSLFYSHKNMKTLFQIASSELKLVNEWFLANKLSLDVKKQSMFYFIKGQCVILSRCSCQL